ncbi:MAG TPA: hypothetical protein VFJ14_16255 [Nocardioidaceae bacterium]|nr:hypothetical protein [Nocardioidaceae bacterium]
MSRNSRAHDIAEQAMGRVAPVIDDARGRLAPLVEEARTQTNETLIPAARSAVGNARSTYDEKVAPQVGAALASATAASEPYREEAKRRGVAALAAARGEVPAPKKKSHKVRNLLVLLGLGGLAAFAVNYFKDDSASWKSDYPTAVPDPSDPISPAESASAVTDDAGAASPDVALADAGEQPHAPTDPDDPLERKDV